MALLETGDKGCTVVPLSEIVGAGRCITMSIVLIHCCKDRSCTADLFMRYLSRILILGFGSGGVL